MRSVTYVTGTSCAGKTTLADKLRERNKPLTAVGGWCVPSDDYLPEPLRARYPDPYHVVDVDQDGTPSGGSGHWLAYRSLDLLARHDAGEFNTDHLVVCGIAMPFEVLDSREAREASVDVRFMLLDVTDEQLEARLLERFPKPKKERELREHYVRTNGLLAKRLRQQVRHLHSALVVDAHTTVAERVRVTLEDW